MHMADALVSTPVALVSGGAAAVLIAVASKKVAKIKRDEIVPLMGVMGAFVFAAQMLNFAIPGTGSSGHIIGGVLLAALLGPWAAFITLASVLIIQCLLFADGGLMALGCNLINMGAVSTLFAYPLVYRPIAGSSNSKWRVMAAAVAACTVGLEAGALLVTVETELSGITALPTVDFLKFMIPIHFVIGLCEGVATGLVIWFVMAVKPDLLYRHCAKAGGLKGISKRTWIVIGAFAVVALGGGLVFAYLASSAPDGLEWSILNITGSEELAPARIPSTAVMPDYDSACSGVVGGLVVLTLIWGVCRIIFHRRRHAHA